MIIYVGYCIEILVASDSPTLGEKIMYLVHRNDKSQDKASFRHGWIRVEVRAPQDMVMMIAVLCIVSFGRHALLLEGSFLPKSFIESYWRGLGHMLLTDTRIVFSRWHWLIS